MKKSVTIIGSGFSSLSCACYLAKAGFEVNILEKNSTIGGRARRFEAKGFVFDMGPSWYWMPDVFDNFFSDFGVKTADYYELIRLDPSYRVFFAEKEQVDIPANFEALKALFESYQEGAGAGLQSFIEEAQYKYDVGMNDLVQRPSLSLLEFASWPLLKDILKMDVFTSLRKHAAKYFTHPVLKDLIEFPVLFLGATASKIPALYSLMNFADLKLGTWYPKGGMHEIVIGMEQLATSLGVTFHLGCTVTKINTKANKVKSVSTTLGEFVSDYLVSGADYVHTEQLLNPSLRNYSEAYWDKRTMAPSSLLFYIGTKEEIPGLKHHNLFFDRSLDDHAHEIYVDPKWPKEPLFYICAPSKTDKTVAPKCKENIFALIPLAPDLEDTEELRQKYLEIIVDRLKFNIGVDISDKIEYIRSYAHLDFKSDYNSYKGNAYGLANTLMQTAILKPKLINKKLNNLFYCGQLTVPGPGVPPSLISGKIVAQLLTKHDDNEN